MARETEDEKKSKNILEVGLVELKISVDGDQKVRRFMSRLLARATLSFLLSLLHIS